MEINWERLNFQDQELHMDLMGKKTIIYYTIHLQIIILQELYIHIIQELKLLNNIGNQKLTLIQMTLFQNKFFIPQMMESKFL